MTIRAPFMIAILVIAFTSLTPQNAEAQLFKKKRKTELPGDKKSGKSDVKSIKEVTESAEKFEGLFTMYRDTVTGESWMAIPAEAFENEFIYFSQVEDGVLQTGNFRGSYRSNKIVTFHKHYDRIELHQENTGYYFNPESPLSKAEDANINSPILASLKILGEDSAGTTYLISGDALFLSEKISMIKPPSRSGRKSALGMLSKEKTKITEFNNYPENLEVKVDYVYDNASPSVYSNSLTASSYISLLYLHAFLHIPE